MWEGGGGDDNSLSSSARGTVRYRSMAIKHSICSLGIYECVHACTHSESCVVSASGL